MILMIVCIQPALILFFAKTSWPIQIDKWMMVANHLDCHRGGHGLFQPTR